MDPCAFPQCSVLRVANRNFGWLNIQSSASTPVPSVSPRCSSRTEQSNSPVSNSTLCPHVSTRSACIPMVCSKQRAICRNAFSSSGGLNGSELGGWLVTLSLESAVRFIFEHLPTSRDSDRMALIASLAEDQNNSLIAEAIASLPCSGHVVHVGQDRLSSFGFFSMSRKWLVLVPWNDAAALISSKVRVYSTFSKSASKIRRSMKVIVPFADSNLI